MNYGAGAYAQYMTSTSNTVGSSRDFFFGPTEWNLSPNGKAQAKAIRPVWIPAYELVVDYSRQSRVSQRDSTFL